MYIKPPSPVSRHSGWQGVGWTPESPPAAFDPEAPQVGLQQHLTQLSVHLVDMEGEDVVSSESPAGFLNFPMTRWHEQITDMLDKITAPSEELLN